MRLFGAALFVVFGLSLFIAGMSWLSQSIHGKWLNAVIPWMMGATFLFLLAAASRIFSEPDDRSVNPVLGSALESHAAFVARMEAQGLLVDHEYRATRAMVITDIEHGVPYYFVETGEGVLFISWGMDDDLENDERDPVENSRSVWPPPPSLQNGDSHSASDGMPRFPTTDFTVRLHREFGTPVDVVCRGDVLTPEYLDEVHDGSWYRSMGFPDDGALIPDRTYDAIRTEMMYAARPIPKRSRFLRRPNTD